jgi:hypothetical protein
MDASYSYTVLQGSSFAFQQAQGLHHMMHLTVYNVHWFLRILFSTLAPCAYVTYYQAQGLSGYTSPDDELFLFFDPYALEFFIHYFHQVRTLTFLFRNISGTLH